MSETAGERAKRNGQVAQYNYKPLAFAQGGGRVAKKPPLGDDHRAGKVNAVWPTGIRDNRFD